MKGKKIIGITGLTVPDTKEPDRPLFGIRENYLQLIERFGGVPIVLYNAQSTETLDSYVNLIDGLLIPGGGDIHPSFYNKHKQYHTGRHRMHINTTRDETELYLVRAMRKIGKPVLGICRGLQMINVACGGTLHQHIPTKFVSEKHLDVRVLARAFDLRHDVIVEDKSRLYRAIQKSRFVVNSAHHQSIDAVGEGLRVAARSPAGVIEAVESTDANFVVGVQWHPEKLPDDLSTRRLLKAFMYSIV